MSGHPDSAVGVRHQHILSIFTLMGSFCTCLCILDLFLAPAVMDFPFACFVRWCTIERSNTSRLLHLLSLPVAHRLLNVILWFCSPQQAMLLHIVGDHLTLISHCSGNTEGEVFTTCRQCRHPLPYSLISRSTFPFFNSFFIILPIVPLWAHCHFRAPAPTGAEGWGGWGEVEGIMTETGWKGRERGRR